MTKKPLKFKTYFLAGLVALLPLWFTFFVLRAMFYIVANATRPFLGAFLREWAPLDYAPFLFDLLCFVGTLLIVYLVGLSVTNIIGRRLFQRAESYIGNIPIISDIYFAIRKITDVVLGQEVHHFKRVVMVQFPRTGMYSVGFLTCDQSGELQEKTSEHVVNIFIPTTPNPTSGFLVMVPKEQVTFLDMSVDDAIKMIMSGGLVMPSSPSPVPMTFAKGSI
ncbi:MAG TPA: DUF502 domain-containing protein [Elusimicrobiota bacterium]|nr:DUF502 domain-containing protein [Elusimicrobiota bacterium]